MERQEQLRRAELDAGSCLVGAHKDDLAISINGADARSFASQGQARTAALSVKLAERDIFLDDTGEMPVLLLDDVLSELDAGRQEFVLNRIGGGQTLVTCCDAENVSRLLQGKVLRVEKGRVTGSAEVFCAVFRRHCLALGTQFRHARAPCGERDF